MSPLNAPVTRKPFARRSAVGAELVSPSRVSLRVWAPSHDRVRVVIDGATHDMAADGTGHFEAEVDGRAGSQYGFLLSEEGLRYPDPASRFQPEGPHGPSEVIDANAFVWHDEAWPGVGLQGQVLYQMHVGTFTAEGTWAAAIPELAALRDLGVTVLQLMPVGDFPGEFGWGYDGVNWFAPTRLYGRPDDFRGFVDAAHRLGLGVILDVVYNHFGPSGNYLARFSGHYFTDRHENEWGAAINYDDEHAGPVRELVLANVEYWIREFHVDGFRLDATHAIQDGSAEHLLASLVRRARNAALPRDLLIVAENEPQLATLIRPLDQGGFGIDAILSEDFHHTARVALTGQREAYYTDFAGTGEELLAAARWGALFQGQYFTWHSTRRGAPALDCPPERFVMSLENHDQVANSSTGARLSDLSSPGLLRALTGLLLLGPGTPMLFQGQEHGSTTPFLFFVDHDAELAALVRAGRQQFLSQFSRCPPSSAARPGDCSLGRDAFLASKLVRDENTRTRMWSALHEDLLRLRREDPVLAARHRPPEGVTLDSDVLLMRDITDDGRDRLLVVNLGTDFDLARRAHPFVVPPERHDWHVRWASEALEYGGAGMPHWTRDRWLVPGRAAILLAAEPSASTELA